MRAPYQQQHVYFEDQMRVATRTGLGRKWGPQGHRPKAAVKIGYEFTHLFVAIATGSVFAMFLPALNQECFRVLGQELEQELTAKTLLVADRARAHQQKLLNRERIVLEKILAASPELNPVECFFQQLRRRLAFSVFDSIEQAQELVEKELNYFFDNPQVVSSITNYPYLANTS